MQRHGSEARQRSRASLHRRTHAHTTLLSHTLYCSSQRWGHLDKPLAHQCHPRRGHPAGGRWTVVCPTHDSLPCGRGLTSSPMADRGTGTPSWRGCHVRVLPLVLGWSRSPRARPLPPPKWATDGSARACRSVCQPPRQQHRVCLGTRTLRPTTSPGVLQDMHHRACPVACAGVPSAAAPRARE